MRCRRERDPVAEAEVDEILPQCCFEFRPLPHDLEARLGFQHDGIGPAGPDLRAVAIRPRGEEPLPTFDRIRIVFDHREVGE